MILVIPIALKMRVLYMQAKIPHNTCIQINKRLPLCEFFSYTLTSDLHCCLEQSNISTEIENALELHIALTLIKPSEFISGVVLYHFLRLALQRKLFTSKIILLLTECGILF
jgi:hypothetical protein